MDRDRTIIATPFYLNGIVRDDWRSFSKVPVDAVSYAYYIYDPRDDCIVFYYFVIFERLLKVSILRTVNPPYILFERVLASVGT